MTRGSDPKQRKTLVARKTGDAPAEQTTRTGAARSGPRAQRATQRTLEQHRATLPTPTNPSKPKPSKPKPRKPMPNRAQVNRARPGESTPTSPSPAKARTRPARSEGGVATVRGTALRSRTGEDAAVPVRRPARPHDDERKRDPDTRRRAALPSRTPADVTETRPARPPTRRGFAGRHDDAAPRPPRRDEDERTGPARFETPKDRDARTPRPAGRKPQRPDWKPIEHARPAPPLPAGLFRWFAPCPRGLEKPLADELVACGADTVRVLAGGCQFVGNLRAGYSANLNSRIASRVLRELLQISYRNEHDVYDAALGIDWPALFGAEQTLKVETVAVNSPVRSLEFVTLRVKDAICDRMRDATGARPDVDTRHPDVRIHVFLDPELATFYVDTSGEALFKRGWRQDKVAAPLRENLAAGILALLGWTPATPLLDPFCGSGTIAIEAALAAQHRAPGLTREFGFTRLADFDRALWESMLDDARVAATGDEARIYASDISINAVPIARGNAEHAGVQLEIRQIDALDLQPPCETPGLIVCNPPYGERVHVRGKVPREREPGTGDDAAFFAEFASVLKKRFAGWRVAILSSDPELATKMRLQPARAWPLFNGALACKLFVFDIVAGSNRRA